MIIYHLVKCIFAVYGFKILCEISKGTFDISHKLWTHTPQYVHFTVLYFCVWVTISLNCDVISLSETGPRMTESGSGARKGFVCWHLASPRTYNNPGTPMSLSCIFKVPGISQRLCMPVVGQTSGSHSVESPSMVDPSGIYSIEGPSEICAHSAEVRLAVSGTQPLFTLRLLMSASSLVDFLSLLSRLSTDIKIFIFVKSVIWKTHTNSSQNCMLV